MYRLFLAAIPLAFIACSVQAGSGTTPRAGQPQGQNRAGSQASMGDTRPFRVAPMADFGAPWAMTFLPDGRMLVTEKDGRLLLVSADARTRQVVAGTFLVDSAGQGGLMDVVLHPDFQRNGLVYLSHSE